MGFLSEFRKAVTGGDAGEIYLVAGREVRCPHCGGTRFFEREVLLDGRTMSLLDMEWLGDSAITLTCVECGRVEWFADGGKVERA